jgi:hypothetical protein
MMVGCDTGKAESYITVEKADGITVTPPSNATVIGLDKDFVPVGAPKTVAIGAKTVVDPGTYMVLATINAGGGLGTPDYGVIAGSAMGFVTVNYGDDKTVTITRTYTSPPIVSIE